MTDTSPATPPTTDGPLDREPVAIFLTGLAAVVAAGLAAADALDWVSLDTDQTAAVITFTTAVTGLIGAVLRSRVYAPATVARLVNP